MKKRHALLVLLIFSVFFLCFANPRGSLDVYIFYGDGCPHCKKEEKYLKLYEEKYANLNIHRFEVYYNDENMQLFGRIAEEMGADVSGIPFLIIGDEYIVGFDETLTPARIQSRIEECLARKCPDPARRILFEHSNDMLTDKGGSLAEDETEQPVKGERKRIITLPLLGDIDAHTFSLPVLTVVMGFLDGFNPCAMWALIFLISLLLGMEDRKRMWLLGMTFIAASAFVYFLFMAAWLNLILLFGFVLWIRIGIGILAIVSGGYSIRDALTTRALECTLAGGEERQAYRDKLKKIISQNSLILSLYGIIVLAFMVNLIEIVCSAGFPAIYTQVLSLSQLSAFEYYSYILLYILFFMLDDMFVFVAAMLTFEITGMTTKYVRIARLVGGLLMLLIGMLLIFKPQWLMFG
jgi:glutaredoxin